VALVLARDRQSEVDAAPAETSPELDHLESLEDEGELYTNVGNGMLIGGGAAFLVGTVLVLYQGYSGGGDHRSSVSLAPLPAASGAGVMLRVTLP
jgi:hypothetical protein